MPRRPHGGDETGPGRGRPTAGSVREGEDAVEGAAQIGRVGRSGASPSGQTDHFTTHMTGDPSGVPEGRPTRSEPDDDEPTRLSIERENVTAALLADRGYRIRQNPTPDEVARARQDTGDTGNPRSNPDYLLEGRVFDCYSPTNLDKSPRGVWSGVSDKVVKLKQTQRMIVDLEHWRGDMSALRRQFRDWPMEGLKEVKVITPDGDIVQIPINREEPPSGA